VTNENVLNVIKTGNRYVERFSSNIFEDTETAKNVFDNIYPPDDNTVVKGYIQDIHMNKYGMLMYSEKQVSLLSNFV
jgi:hypothetical protein